MKPSQYLLAVPLALLSIAPSMAHATTYISTGGKRVVVQSDHTVAKVAGGVFVAGVAAIALAHPIIHEIHRMEFFANRVTIEQQAPDEYVNNYYGVRIDAAQPYGVMRGRGVMSPPVATRPQIVERVGGGGGHLGGHGSHR